VQGQSRTALISLFAMVAVLLSTAICLAIQAVVPRGSGPEIALFPYNTEVVAVGILGGVLPLVASFAMIGASQAWRDDGGPRPFRSSAYWITILAVALLLTVFFTASQYLYGGLGVPKLWAFWLTVAGGVGGVDYWWLRGRRIGLAWGAAECYSMGTFSVFVSDVLRTLGGLATAPGEAAVWGGGGLLDIVFWFGIYTSASFLLLDGLTGLFARAR